VNATLTAWFGHLRTDRRGIPVPWINLWGREDRVPVSIEWDPNVQMRAVFMDDSNQDVPDFTRQHMGRQRAAMVRGWCQVCGRPVPWRRRFLIVSSLSASTVTIDGHGESVVLAEPWLDERCATFAMQRCPALIRRIDTTDLRLIPVTSPEQVRLVVSRGHVDGFPDTRQHPVAMWVKAVPLGVTVEMAGADS
jgi:hypothetical protein